MIACIGTTPTLQRTMVFDRLIVDDVNRAAEVREYASGKSINVARVLKALGREALAAGFAGGDRGQLLLQDLDAIGVRHDFTEVRARTRLCITAIDRGAGAATELIEESSPVEENGWMQLTQKLEAALPDSRPWVFSGSLPPGAPRDFYARWPPLAWRCSGGGRMLPVIIDASGEPMRRALETGDGFIAKMNRRELGLTLGMPVDTDAALHEAMRAAAKRCGHVVVTLGAQGALALVNSELWRVAIPQVKAISAIGSGDAFAAGMAAVIDEGDARDAWRLGAACGIANALTAEAGHVRLQDVERLKAQVEVHRLTT